MYPWQYFILGLCKYLAWPILVAICICYFRANIRDILKRIKTLPFGTELNPQTVQEQQDAKKDFDEEFRKKQQEAQAKNTKSKTKTKGRK